MESAVNVDTIGLDTDGGPKTPVHGRTVEIQLLWLGSFHGKVEELRRTLRRTSEKNGCSNR
jgi:hypothetical protein